jgi:hypothetical protein
MWGKVPCAMSPTQRMHADLGGDADALDDTVALQLAQDQRGVKRACPVSWKSLSKQSFKNPRIVDMTKKKDWTEPPLGTGSLGVVGDDAAYKGHACCAQGGQQLLQ